MLKKHNIIVKKYDFYVKKNFAMIKLTKRSTSYSVNLEIYVILLVNIVVLHIANVI